ncbi:butyrophilin-like protein 2 isoform X2 [Astatotilapia calliptera]|uniref:butyrophilin-like protein 2 isoform X2 n=1 Tax=Astatotilapia calliptera TaxID=8154 RepID=UPI000E405B22|nr:butyrophilin-like protein 2 isoform X2 [Astatotilapia calliptera]
MKTLLTSLLLVLVSQHALTAVVEVYEGVMSVLLPCKHSGFIPEDDPTVLWTRSDLNPKSVHVRREEADDLRGQNQRYSGRTSMRPDALDSLDFSLTLRNPTKTDSSIYTCSISDGTEDQRLRDIQLQVKDQQVEVKVVGGSDSVILPCQIKPDLPEDTTVEWTRSDQELVHVYSNRSDDLTKQDGLYRDRTKMNEDLLRTGDLSLTLKHPTERDSGGYICTIYRDKNILRQKVVLQVKEPFPSWATALLVFLLLVLVVSAVLLFNFWHHIMSFIPVEVEVVEGAESVQLPFKTTKNLPEDVKVLWERYDPRMKAHVYHNGSDLPEEQSEVYRGRTRMRGDPLRTGDLSLTVERPTEGDGGEYKCLVWRRGDFIRKKTVRIRVKGRVQVQDQTAGEQL